MSGPDLSNVLPDLILLPSPVARIALPNFSINQKVVCLAFISEIGVVQPNPLAQFL